MDDELNIEQLMAMGLVTQEDIDMQLALSQKYFPRTTRRLSEQAATNKAQDALNREQKKKRSRTKTTT